MSNKSCAVTALRGNQGVVQINPGMDVVVVETAPDGAGSAITLPASDGQTISVVNNTGVNIKVFPPVGGSIAGGAVNAAVTMTPVTDKFITFASFTGLNYSQSDVMWG